MIKNQKINPSIIYELPKLTLNFLILIFSDALPAPNRWYSRSQSYLTI